MKYSSLLRLTYFLSILTCHHWVEGQRSAALDAEIDRALAELDIEQGRFNAIVSDATNFNHRFRFTSASNTNNRGSSVTQREIEEAIANSMTEVESMGKDILKAVLFKKNPQSTGPPLIENTKIKMGFVSSMAATKIMQLMRDHNVDMNKYQIATFLKAIDLNQTAMEKECPYTKIPTGRICNPYYREIDGYCNNLKYPWRGTTSYPAQRFIPADYGDGINEPRQAVDGNELPHPRVISTMVLPSAPREHSSVTNMMMVFGQLMDHEFAFASSPTGFMFGKLKCCEPKNRDHPLCMSMAISTDDSFFGRHKVKCMEAVRTLPAIDADCRMGPRNHNNDVTSFIDASAIYGSTAEIGNNLRSYRGGLLKTQPNPDNPSLKPLMPTVNQSTSLQCEIRRGPYKCFGAGDGRANENSLLIVIHTLFVREHNRIAEILGTTNPQWDDEKIYQESRRIVAAQIQHIAFNEFLPILIGYSNVLRFGLELGSTGYFVGYDPEYDATVDHGFVTAAFRFGHSLINKDMFRITPTNSRLPTLALRDDFFQPQHIYRRNFPDGMDPIMRGIFYQHTQNMDNHIVDDVRNHLFKLPHEKFGMDLMALNLIRGREQGVPGFNEWREFCQLSRFTNWNDMRGHIFPSALEGLQKAYEHPDDIDLFIGGVSEVQIGEGMLGPTLSCIIGIQFQNMRFGDRFWYENDNVPSVINHAFTPAQLQELRAVTLSKVVCDNSDTIKSIQENVFREPSFQNPILSCENIRGLNLAHWQQNE